MPRWTHLPLLLLPLLVSPAGRLVADDATGRLDAIKPFIGPRTLMVAHVDVSEVDTDRLVELLLTLEPPRPIQANEDGPVIAQPTVQDVRKQLTGMKRMFLDVDARDVFLVLSWDDLPNTRPVVVVPLPRDAGFDPLLKLLPERRDQLVERFHGALVVGPEEAVARLRSTRSVPRADLMAAFEAAGDSPLRVAIASGPLERRALGATLPDLPAPAGTRYRGLLADTRWLAVNGDLQDRPSVAFEMSSNERAKELQSFLRDVLQWATRDPGMQTTVPRIDDITKVLRVGVEANRVTLDVAEKQGVAVIVEALRPKVESLTGAITRDARTNAMKQLGLGFHNFYDAHGKLPGIGNLDDKGKPLLSWRVHLLPYLDQQLLYSKFKRDEPWDSPHNKALLAEMPAIFESPGTQPGTTTYLRPVAKGAIAEAEKFEQITDGLSNTILVVDAGADLAVPWTKPADWEVDAKQPTKGLVRKGQEYFLATFADGSIRTLPADIDAKVLKAYITRNGGEVIPE